jgi:tetratricopeptide (TPR) repeat protein
VAYTDFAIGEFVRHLKGHDLYDESLIVFFSDHGEGLGDHGEPFHGYFLYEATVAVPLGFKLPRSMRIPPGVRIPAAASLMDIYPTLCGLQGIEPPAGLDGRSLAPLLRKPSRKLERDIILSTEMPYFFFGWEKIFAVLRFPLKGIVCSEPQVYDLATDPEESRNLYPKNYTDMVAVAQSAIAGSNEEPSAASVSREEIENLRSLGYLTSFQKPSRREPIPPSRWPEKIKAVSDVDEARFHGDTQAVLKLYADFLEKHPDDFQSLVGRGEIYLRLNELDKAEADLSRALALNDNNFDVHNFLITLYQRKGDMAKLHAAVEYARKRFSDYLFMRPIVEDLLHQQKTGEALAFLRTMMEANPSDAYPFLRTLGLLMDAGRMGEAEAFAAQVLKEGKAGPVIRSHFAGFDEYMKNRSDAALGHFLESCGAGATFHQPYYYAGLIYKEKADWANAVKYLNAARVLSPENPQALYEWSDCLAASGAVQEAYQGFQRASAMDPKNPSPRLALLRCALVLGKQGEAETHRAWLARNAPDVLAAARAQDPALKRMR